MRLCYFFAQEISIGPSTRFRDQYFVFVKHDVVIIGNIVLTPEYLCTGPITRFDLFEFLNSVPQYSCTAFDWKCSKHKITYRPRYSHRRIKCYTINNTISYTSCIPIKSVVTTSAKTRLRVHVIWDITYYIFPIRRQLKQRSDD